MKTVEYVPTEGALAQFAMSVCSWIWGADATPVLGGAAEDCWEGDPLWSIVYNPDSQHNKQKISTSWIHKHCDTQMPGTTSLG